MRKLQIPNTNHYVEFCTHPNKIKNFILNNKLLAIDIETSKHLLEVPKGHPEPGLYPLLSDIEYVQLSNGEETLVYPTFIDTSEFGKGYSFYVFFNLLQERVDNKQLKLVAHNSKFEYGHIFHKTKIKLDLDCTQLMCRIVDGATMNPDDTTQLSEDVRRGKLIHKNGVSLASACERYLGVVLSKAQQASEWKKDEITDEQLLYAGMDAYYTFHLAKKLSFYIRKLECQKIYKLYKKMHQVTSLMELRGFGVNPEIHKKMIKEWEENKEKYAEQLGDYFNNINVNSGKQLGEWLEEFFPELCKNFPRTDKGVYCFNAQVLELYSHLEPFKILAENNKIKKLITTYGNKLHQKYYKHKKGYRVHGNLWIGSTRTGRMSSTNPNLQNMPARGEGKTLRKIFEANDGNLLVCADYSQIEIRVAGLVSNDNYIIECYRQGKDLHRQIVAELMGKSADKVTKAERQMGKAVNFGLLFGMGAKKLAIYSKQSYGVDMSDDEALEFFNAFHRLYKTYSNWCNKQRAISRKSMTVRTPLGRIRKLSERELYTCSVNTVVQGGAAEVVMLACVYCEQRLPAGAYLVNVVHDEIIIECKESLSNNVKNILEESMKDAYIKLFPGAPTLDLTEAHIGKSWNDVK